MRSLHALLSLCAVLMGGAAAMLSVQRHTLILTEGVMWTDGNPRARSVFINGTSPGPTLRFQVGQRVVVRVMNHLPDANTTVHFHGLSQSLHPASDGTGMLTHWPIAPGNFFDYELHIDKRDAGTTFCHAHVGLQATAAFAPVIVEDRPRTLPRSAEERIMAVSDYFYQSDGVMEKGLLGAPFIWPGSAKSIALNGAAWGAPDACNATLATAQGVKCEASTYAGPAVIDVDYEHHYRLRWIGAQTLMHLAIGIFGHSQHIIAADGTLVRPVKTEFLELLGGQRYDAHLVTKSRGEVARDGSHGCYPIRFETRWRTPATNGWAMLRYPGAQCNTTPTSQHPFNNSRAYFPPAVDFWLSHRLHPLHRQDREPRDEEVSRRVYINAQQVPVLFNNSGFRWVSNGIYYNDSHPTMGDGKMLMKPYLMQLYAGEREAPSYDRAMTPPPGVQQGFDSASSVFVARRGEVVDVVIINNASVKAGTTETHPWHMHGPDHHTVAMGLGDFTEDKFRKARLLFRDAVARDTTAVWPGRSASSGVPLTPLPANSSGAWSVLRIKVPSNGEGNGVWMLHCHWAFHLAMGMSTIWAFSPEDVVASTVGLYRDPEYLIFGRNVTADM